MSKLYGRETFSAEVNGVKYDFTCYGQDTSYGFRHICCSGISDTTNLKYVRSDIVSKSCYYNRTWESFKYETVLRKAIKQVSPSKEVEDKLTKILIEKVSQDKAEESKNKLSEFTTLWSGLSEENKDHIRKGLGDNLIQTEEQADAIVGMMKFMTVFQDMK